MTVRIYPSRLPSEPLETHEHGSLTLASWFHNNVHGWSQDREHPITVDVDGLPVPAHLWDETVIHAGSDVRMYPVPYGLEIGVIGWIAIATAVASVAFSVYMMSQIGDVGGYSSPGTGDRLDTNTAKANSAKLGDPIRELFGRYRVYPDYVVQPVTRFDAKDPTKMTVEMFLCLCTGDVSFSNGDIKIGATPVTSLGDGFDYAVYPPSTNVSGDVRSENWVSSTEVGGSSSGAGLDMAQTSPTSDDITADSMTVAGADVSFTGINNNKVPASWIAGRNATITAPAGFVVSSDSGYSVLSGNSLSEIAPHPGMPVTVDFSGVKYDLVIAAYTPAQAAIPGVGGSAAKLTGNAAPSTYDFSINHETFTLAWQGTYYIIALVANYEAMTDLLQDITYSLTGSGLIAKDDNGRISITESGSPWRGGSITSSYLPETVFGSAPAFVTGVASTDGTPAVIANIRLAYDEASGTAFGGVPEGVQRIAVSHRGNEYRIQDTDGATAVLKRLIDGVIDESWPGFSPRTMIDYSATGINDNDRWMGPFLACPQNEVVDCFEVNFSFPSGICGFDKKGRKENRNVGWEIQYRDYGSGSGWISKRGTYRQKNINGLGFTERITLDSPGLVEVRCRRTNEQGSNNARDSMYWQALRGRLLTRPTSYPGVTTMGVTVETGGKLSAQSDRRVNVVASRIYGSGAARSISGALQHVGQSLGLAMDTETITALEDNYWTPSNEFFDFATSDSTSALEMLQKIANAGKSYFLLSDGLASVSREGVKPWAGIISPQEMTEELQTAFVAPSADDYDGVDVTYINGTTWAEETVQCRTADNLTPMRVEDYTLDGVVDRDRAYQIGMRRLMKYRKQRLTFTTTTELDALCYNVGDRLILTDDIPGSKTISCLVEDMASAGGITTFTVTEPLDWSFENPRAVIRYQDGSASSLMIATRVGDYQLSVPELPEFLEIEMGNPSIEPPRLIFCDSSRVGYDALITEISPQSDGTCQVTANEYREDFYTYDNATYPGDVS